MSAHGAARAARRERSGADNSRALVTLAPDAPDCGRARGAVTKAMADTPPPSRSQWEASRGGAASARRAGVERQRERCGQRRSPLPLREPTRGHPASPAPDRRDRRASAPTDTPASCAGQSKKLGINTERTIPPFQARTATNRRPWWDVYFTGLFTTIRQMPKT